MIDESERELEAAGYGPLYLTQRPEGVKICTKCKRPKVIATEFYKAKDSWCKECLRAAMRENSKKRRQQREACTCGAVEPEVVAREPDVVERAPARVGETLHELGLKWITANSRGTPAVIGSFFPDLSPHDEDVTL
jgi:hypothetical protein